jgi:hypothetical protein
VLDSRVEPAAMNESLWDAKLKSFLKKTGDDFKRFGNDVKTEANKLMSEVKDPVRQQKLREGLHEVGDWAKKTAEEVAVLVESGVKKAEKALVKASDRANELVGVPTAPAAPKRAPPTEQPVPPKVKAKKTVGKSTKKAAAPKNAKRAPPAKKTMGR